MKDRSKSTTLLSHEGGCILSKKPRKKKAKRKGLKNGISKTDIQAGQKSLADGFASRYEEIKREIDQLVLDIRTNVSRSNPELLMDYLAAMNFMLMLNKPTELDFKAEENFQIRSVEYIQSVLVGTENQYKEVDDPEGQENLFGMILNQTIELYQKTPLFLMCWGMKAKEEGAFF